MTKLLVTTDFSKRSRSALEEALELSKTLSEPEIHVLFVVEEHSASPLYAHYELPPIDHTHLEEQMKKFLGRSLNQVQWKIVSASSVTEGVLQYARKIKANYIIASSHGFGAVGSLFLGSNTQKIISKSNIPIIIVK